MSFLLLFGLTAFAVHVFFYFVFTVAVIRKRNDLADIAWGMGFILVMLLSLLLTGNGTERFQLIFLLILIWGVRLALHIFMRNRSKGEDSRYKKWRNEWGKWWILRSYFQVFFLQAWILLIIATPIMWIAVYGWSDLYLYDYFFFLLWLVGFIFEAVADSQLMEFKRDPKNKGKIMTTGIWKYSRHPNYFGEVCMWWAIFLLALPTPLGFITIVSPLLITYLITQVSGIPLLEEKYKGRADWERYKKQTSIFFPGIPKK